MRLVVLAVVVLVALSGCSISRHYEIEHGHCMIRERQRIVGVKIGDTQFACPKGYR